MHFGYLVSDTPGVADRTLAAFATRLEQRGFRLAGAVQTNTETLRGGRCDMDVRVLGGGPIIRISQSLGPGARGCRLDLAALEHAVAEVTSRSVGDVDIVLLNKFGKHEAEGRGFRHLIADLLARDIPVLTSVNVMNLDAFESFACGLAQELPADVAALEHWLGAFVGSAAA